MTGDAYACICQAVRYGMFWRKPGWRGMQIVLYYLIAIRACLVYLYRSVIQCRKGGEKWMRNYNRSVGFSSIYYFRLTLSRRARYGVAVPARVVRFTRWAGGGGQIGLIHIIDPIIW